MADFCNSSNYYELPPFYNFMEFEYGQNDQYTEDIREDEKNAIYFQQYEPLIENKKEKKHLSENSLEVDKVELQILPKQKFNEKIDQPKQNLINSTTKNSTEILRKKIKRNDEDFGEEKETKFNKNGKKSKNARNIKNIEIAKNGEEKKTQGRKKKEETDKGNHTKHIEDNIMRKIKSNFFKFCHNLLNKSLKDKSWPFLRMKSTLNENLKRDYNVNLLNKTFKELYQETPISRKYRSQKKDRHDKNQKLIEKIYDDNFEIDTIKLLNLTYRELFDVFTRKIKNISPELEMKIEGISLLENDEFTNINKFFNEVEEQLKKDKEPEEDIKNYLENLEKLCLNYENWFLLKKGRNRNEYKKMK